MTPRRHLEFPFADIAVALKIATDRAVRDRQETEHVAHAIELFPPTASHVIAERQRQADLLAEAHRIIRGLMAVEHTIRAMLEADRAA
jgi:hypothetical protein